MVSKVCVVLSALLAVSFARPRPQSNYGAPPPSSSYGAPPSGGGSNNGRLPGGNGGGGGGGAKEPGMPYDFNWAVQDDASGNDYSHQESSDGNVVTGEYRVLLPDSRVQIVRFTADHENGYQAEVTYEGEAVFPDTPSGGGGSGGFGGGNQGGSGGGFGGGNQGGSGGGFGGGSGGFGGGSGGFGGGSGGGSSSYGAPPPGGSSYGRR